MHIYMHPKKESVIVLIKFLVRIDNQVVLVSIMQDFTVLEILYLTPFGRYIQQMRICE